MDRECLLTSGQDSRLINSRFSSFETSFLRDNSCLCWRAQNDFSSSCYQLALWQVSVRQVVVFPLYWHLSYRYRSIFRGHLVSGYYGILFQIIPRNYRKFVEVLHCGSHGTTVQRLLPGDLQSTRMLQFLYRGANKQVVSHRFRSTGGGQLLSSHPFTGPFSESQ